MRSTLVVDQSLVEYQWIRLSESLEDSFLQLNLSANIIKYPTSRINKVLNIFRQLNDKIQDEIWKATCYNCTELYLIALFFLPKITCGSKRAWRIAWSVVWYWENLKCVLLTNTNMYIKYLIYMHICTKQKYVYYPFECNTIQRVIQEFCTTKSLGFLFVSVLINNSRWQFQIIR